MPWRRWSDLAGFLNRGDRIVRKSRRALGRSPLNEAVVPQDERPRTVLRHMADSSAGADYLSWRCRSLRRYATTTESLSPPRLLPSILAPARD